MSTDLELNKTVYFHNPLEEPFTFLWDKQATVVPPKTTVPMAAFLARHGGKHLIDYIILHPEFWKKLGLKRTDTEEKFDTDGKQIKVRSDLTKGREDIAKLINVTGPMEAAISKISVPNKLADSEEESEEEPKEEKEFPDLN